MDIIKTPKDQFNVLTGLIAAHLLVDIILGFAGWTLAWSIISVIVTLISTILAFNIYNASIKKLDNKSLKTLFEFVLALLIIHVIVSFITLLVLGRGSGSQASNVAKQPNRNVFFLSGGVLLVIIILQIVAYTQFKILSKL